MGSWDICCASPVQVQPVRAHRIPSKSELTWEHQCRELTASGHFWERQLVLHPASHGLASRKALVVIFLLILSLLWESQR